MNGVHEHIGKFSIAADNLLLDPGYTTLRNYTLHDQKSQFQGEMETMNIFGTGATW